MSDERFCTSCGGGPWPPQRFYKAVKRKDGTYRRMRRCKVCIRKTVKENQDAKAERLKLVKAAYAKRPERKATLKAYRQSERGKQVMRESRKAWKVCHPEQHRDIQRKWNRIRNQRRATRKTTNNLTTGAIDENRTERRAHETDGVRGDASVTG